MARLKTFNNRKRRKIPRSEFYWHTDTSHPAGWKQWDKRGGKWKRHTPKGWPSK